MGLADESSPIPQQELELTEKGPKSTSVCGPAAARCDYGPCIGSPEMKIRTARFVLAATITSHHYPHPHLHHRDLHRQQDHLTTMSELRKTVSHRPRRAGRTQPGWCLRMVRPTEGLYLLMEGCIFCHRRFLRFRW